MRSSASWSDRNWTNSLLLLLRRIDLDEHSRQDLADFNRSFRYAGEQNLLEALAYVRRSIARDSLLLPAAQHRHLDELYRRLNVAYGVRLCEKTIAANYWAIYCRCAGLWHCEDFGCTILRAIGLLVFIRVSDFSHGLG